MSDAERAGAEPGLGASAGKATSTADIEAQLRTIQEDIRRLGMQVADLLDHKTNEAVREVKTRLSDATEKGREAVDAVQDVADRLGEAIEDSLARKPYATLACVAGIGFLIGALWRR
jgi:ElaB/YqjD/DUF883 family membrane-anchored ribosome-binding protein